MSKHRPECSGENCDTKVWWRQGGIRRTCGPWNPADGKTGFYQGRRIIEEPNALSVALRGVIQNGGCISVSGKMYSCYEDVIDAIVQERPRSEEVAVLVYPNGLEDKFFGMILRPEGRMTPLESWVVSSSYPPLRKDDHKNEDI